VPSDNAFCGKCGYAMRNHGPERVDQSRIRVYEERRAEAPESPAAEEPSSSASSQQRLRTRTRLGMPALTPAEVASPPEPAPIDPPKADRPRRKVQHKTMLGIPRDDIPPPPLAPSSEALDDAPQSRPPSTSPSERTEGSHRARARVQYDSEAEAVPVVQRRRNALRGLALLVLFAAAWLGYRLLTLNG
jgi:hypothetical protein